ncbi:MAG TPA: hypothetical protein H9889_05285 [Candidatus Ignatzschineria merdigallinarum]|uniref:VCBS repeat-containing protein n=1 Tax=Candidatus Ignatzschineria merdigallinarum TaxID=2838621 RepID=A0A9D1TU09_9GAMM|nr:hypothetical protein [Candidatus Ignatzschineria merdigallinarum]
MRSSLLKLSSLLLLSMSSLIMDSTFDAPLNLEEKVTHKISSQIDFPELRYAFLFDDNNHHDLFHSVRLYNTNNELLQTIEGENLREHMFWGDIGSSPTLIDINEDGYLDLIIKVSAGSLGEFASVWLFNPETERYQAVLEEILYPKVVANNLIASTYTSRRDPFISYLSAYQILPDFSFTNTDWTSFIIPLKKAGESYYCVSDPILHHDGNVNYSLEIILDDKEKLTAESFALLNALDLTSCYPALSEIISSFPQENFRSLSLIQLPIQQNLSEAETSPVTITVNPEWQKIAVNYQHFGDKIATMQCPIIPYIDLDHQRIKAADLISFEGLSEEMVMEDYGYPIICDYEGKPY